jgi:hypothetical protein
MIFMNGSNIIKMTIIHTKLETHGWYELILLNNDEAILMIEKSSVMSWKLLLLNSWKYMN